MWPVKLGTKEEIFVMQPPDRFRNHAWTSDTAEKQMDEWKDGLRKKEKKSHRRADSTIGCTHMLRGSCTLAWASSSEAMDATLGGTSTPAEEGEGPWWDAS